MNTNLREHQVPAQVVIQIQDVMNKLLSISMGGLKSRHYD